MSLLKKAIKEMRSYGEMGLPDGESGMGMGSADVSRGEKPSLASAYRMNKIMRHRNAAEEEEMGMEPEMGMDDEMPADDMEAEDPVGGVEEIKQFFMDNPTPSDEEVAQYAEEHGIDMQQMRQEVYELIQSLLGTTDEERSDMEELPDEEMSADAEGEDDEIEFNTRIS